MTEELNLEELNGVSGGDKARAAAVLEALLLIKRIDRENSIPDPVPYVPMKL